MRHRATHAALIAMCGNRERNEDDGKEKPNRNILSLPCVPLIDNTRVFFILDFIFKRLQCIRMFAPSWASSSNKCVRIRLVSPCSWLVVLERVSKFQDICSRPNLDGTHLFWLKVFREMVNGGMWKNAACCRPRISVTLHFENQTHRETHSPWPST